MLCKSKPLLIIKSLLLNECCAQRGISFERIALKPHHLPLKSSVPFILRVSRSFLTKLQFLAGMFDATYGASSAFVNTAPDLLPSSGFALGEFPTVRKILNVYKKV